MEKGSAHPGKPGNPKYERWAARCRCLCLALADRGLGTTSACGGGALVVRRNGTLAREGSSAGGPASDMRPSGGAESGAAGSAGPGCATFLPPLAGAGGADAAGNRFQCVGLPDDPFLQFFPQ